MSDSNVDLRSDTVTQPSTEMREAMAQAPVGDDVYGEDPTINELQSTVAELLGHEAGLFVPSGTLGNQLGLRLLCKPGQEILCGSTAHIARAEGGAAAALSGITFRTWHASGGHLDVPYIRDELATPAAGPHIVSTAAIAVEDTHNFNGGALLPAADRAAVLAAARDLEITVHCDGARLWNAHVATGVPLRELAGGYDTVSVCLSKGLGAPVGSVLVSSSERIAEAHAWRKRYGGGMRQAGILAAAGLYALRHNLDRLADDHARARRLAEGLGADPASAETNILVLRVPDAAAIAASAKQSGVLVSALGPRVLRAVTHLDVDDAGVDRALHVLQPLVAGRVAS